MATPRDPSDSSLVGYEAPVEERPTSASPTEQQIERELPAVHRLDYSPAPPRHDPYAAMRLRPYRLFSLGWFVAVVGYQIQATALRWEIFDRTQSYLSLGWIAGIQVIPLMLLALPAGQLADTFDRRRIITIASLAAAACAAGLAMVSYRLTVMPLYVLVVISSAAMVCARPARAALLPQIVPPAIFPNAVTWNSMIFQVSGMSGPAVAGWVIDLSLRRYGSVWPAYAIHASCLVIMAATITMLPKPRPLPAAQDDGQTALQRLSAGLRFVWNTPLLMAALTLDLFAVLLGGAAYLLPVFAKEILKVGPVGLGWLQAAEAVGAFSMAMVLAHLPPMKRAGRALLLAVVGFGVCTIVFGLSKNFWLSMAALVVLGMMDNISVVVRHTLVQLITPDPMRGRVSAVNQVFIGASNELGGLESGLTAALFGPVRAVMLGGIGTIAVVVAVASRWPQVRKLGRLTEVEAPGSPP
mgnify:FL=1